MFVASVNANQDLDEEFKDIILREFDKALKSVASLGEILIICPLSKIFPFISTLPSKIRRHVISSDVKFKYVAGILEPFGSIGSHFFNHRIDEVKLTCHRFSIKLRQLLLHGKNVTLHCTLRCFVR